MRAGSGGRVERVGVCLAILAIACAEPSDAAEERGQTAPSPPPVEASGPPPVLERGIDVSHHNGAVDWGSVVAAGHSFAVLKATEGVDDLDPAFHREWPRVRAAGLVRGAYHFYVTEDDPVAQAGFFLETVSFIPGDLVPVVDIELIGHDTQPGLVERFQIFLDTVERRVGAKPIIYTAAKFWDAHMSDAFGDYPLWIAEWGVETPVLPGGWSGWHLWQFSDDAQIPGVEKTVDVTRVNRSDADLSALFIPE